MSIHSISELKQASLSFDNTQCLLSSTYFGPIQWYQKLNRYQTSWIERYDSYQKQTYRNRCMIATTNGLQALTVPVVRGETNLMKDIRISDHGNWRHLHWHALLSAYSESPFFEYYMDDIHPFFEKKWDFLYDFNLEICHTVCSLLDIRPTIRPTDTFCPKNQLSDDISTIVNTSNYCVNKSNDFRDAINPKHPQDDSTFVPKQYYQVYNMKFGFQSNLSILDLLFNMGPEGIFYL